MRIVSLIPSATEIIGELGLTDNLVGRSCECNWPPSILNTAVVSLSRVDSLQLSGAQIDAQVRSALGDGKELYSIDEEVLRQLAPDVIITQDLCQVCAVSSDNVCDVGARVISLDPRTINEVAESVAFLGAQLGVAAKGKQVADHMLERIEKVRRAVVGRKRPRVFIAEWLDPPFASGHWIPEMVDAAGGIEVLGKPGVPSVTTSWQAVRDAKPEIVIFAPCGFDEVRAAKEAAVLVDQFDPNWQTACVNADRFFARPAPSIADGIEQLAKIFHGVEIS
ncbi:MAG: ABC transporter substrate-binding protein [Actinomycetota bacterium]|nr:ABC transporter substrate-binding protein [Actinomycetota bacterium]MDA3042326.1 ABC transporter substrate-binding protein [Actinomycetota bacterium]MDP4850685.1 ABC transporter substrate-binding protein [Ilumatobacteraceae bacterium]MDP5087426.1 ABC transporter substrate-binding protein [Ilumatobacteraceae bacterium]HBZ61959.1 cobalamin-binding protein [Acidimicrobium sp.]